MNIAVSSVSSCGRCGPVHGAVPGAEPYAFAGDADAGPSPRASDRPVPTTLALRLGELGHWAWVPALYCLALMWVIPSWLLRLPLLGLAVLCVAGGYAASRSLRHPRRGDLEPEYLAGTTQQSAIRRLPGAYASVVVCCHVYVTALIGLHAGFPDLRAEAPAAVTRAGTRAVDVGGERMAEVATHLSVGRSSACLAAKAFELAPWVRPCVSREHPGGGGTNTPARTGQRVVAATFASR